MERVVRRTSLHPRVDNELQKIVDENGRTISNQIAKIVKEALAKDGCVIKKISPETMEKIKEACEKENRSVESLFVLAMDIFLNRVEYVRTFR